MGHRIAQLPPDKNFRRRVTVGGVDLVVWMRVDGVGGGRGIPMMAVGKVGQRHNTLRWKKLADVIAESWSLDVGLLYGHQLNLEDAHA